MEQLVARWAHNPEAAGSSPAPATEKEERDVVVPKGIAAFFCLHSPIGLAVSKVFNNFLFTYSGRFNIIEHESHSPLSYHTSLGASPRAMARTEGIYIPSKRGI